MKKHRQLVIGIIIGSTLFGAVPTFAETTSTISAIFDRVKLVVNGEQTDTSTLLYDGRTYVQLRGAADAFGAELEWDGNTNTAYLNTVSSTPAPTPQPTATPTATPKPIATQAPNPTPKPEPEYGRFNPAPIKTLQTTTITNSTSEYTVDIKVHNVIRGDAAWKMLQEASKYNKEPDDGYEYLVVDVFVEVKKSNTNKKMKIYYGNFDVFSNDYKDYDSYLYSVTEPKPELNYEINEGESETGYLVFMVKENDKPLLQYGGDYKGAGGVWFKLSEY